MTLLTGVVVASCPFYHQSKLKLIKVAYFCPFFLSSFTEVSPEGLDSTEVLFQPISDGRGAARLWGGDLWCPHVWGCECF